MLKRGLKIKLPMTADKPRNIDAYIAAFPEETQAILLQVRATVQAAAAEATETISYAIPTFVFHGNLVHFAAYKNHIGFYPGAGAIAVFKDKISGYKNAKGSVQFPIAKPMPLDLITEIVAFRVRENVERAKIKNK